MTRSDSFTLIERLRRRASNRLRALAFELAPSNPQFWQQRVRMGGPSARAFRTAAQALQSNSCIVEADHVLARAAGAFAEDRAILIASAMSAHNRAQYETAIQRWECALAVAFDDPMCHAGLAANLRETGRLQQAASTIAAALDRFPDHLLIVTEAGRIASARGADEDSLSLWAFAAGTPDAHPEWLHAHVRSLACLSRYSEAQAALRQARLRHPDDRNLMQLEAELSVLGTRSPVDAA